MRVYFTAICYWNADDTAFFVKDATNATDCLSSLSHNSSMFGLHTSWPKTKLQSVGSDSGPNLLNVVVDGNPVDLVESFTYLDSIQTRPRQCHHSITFGIPNIFIFRRKFVFIKHWFCQSCYMHRKHGPCLPLTWKPSNPFTWSVSEGSLESGGMILSVTLRSLRTGLAPVSDRITRGRNAIFGHVARCQITLQHTRPCYAKSSCRSVNSQTLNGNVHQADLVPNGPTNSAATTTMLPLRLCGGKPLVAVTRERRYGPSRLHVNDDDDVLSIVTEIAHSD